MNSNQKKRKSGPHGQRVQVVVRVRPQLENTDRTWVQVVDRNTLHIINHRNVSEILQYEFERVFDQDTTQATIYKECVQPLLDKALNGQNASVFAYGPTGAGKTHTILGTAEDPGIIPRCLRGIFNAIGNEKSKPDAADWTFKVSFSYLEIYQEKVYDLLNPSQTDLSIREDQNHNIFVTGLKEQPISDVKTFTKCFAPASKKRTTAMTKLNERSSRSHSLLLIKIIRKQEVSPFKILTGKLYLVDLAGSEDNRRTGNQGIRLRESGAINSSLLALSQVVDALNKGKACIPYRSSKLTRLLQDSLGGSAYTSMIVNLAPEERHYFDTYTTLNFARKTKKVVNQIKINESIDKIVKPVDHLRKRRRSIQDEIMLKKQKMDPVSFISPLLQNQEQFHSEIREMASRLTEVEKRILEQMKLGSQGRTPISVKNDDSMKMIEPTFEKLEFIMKELQNLQNTSKNKKDSGMQKSQSVSSLQIRTCEDINKRVSSDYSAISSKAEDISGSPPFVRPKAIRKRCFISTAAKRSDEEEIKSFCALNADLQKAHNDRILMILNTGTIKELKDLQTVGEKRAKLIHDWRSINGHFKTFDDLRSVHGLTSRYVDSFLKCNLVNLEV